MGLAAGLPVYDLSHLIRRARVFRRLETRQVVSECRPGARISSRHASPLHDQTLPNLVGHPLREFDPQPGLRNGAFRTGLTA